MEYPHGLTEWIGINMEGAMAAAITTTIIYLIFLFVVRILGARMLSSLTTFDTIMTLLFGSVVARTALGPVATLGAGITTFFTLIILHVTLGNIAHTRRGALMITNSAKLLMAGSTIIEKNMKATHTTHTELISKLRESGIHSVDEVAAVIMESSGKLSVLSRNRPLDREILTGVQDIELLSDDLFN